MQYIDLFSTSYHTNLKRVMEYDYQFDGKMISSCPISTEFFTYKSTQRNRSKSNSDISTELGADNNKL